MIGRTCGRRVQIGRRWHVWFIASLTFAAVASYGTLSRVKEPGFSLGCRWVCSYGWPCTYLSMEGADAKVARGQIVRRLGDALPLAVLANLGIALGVAAGATLLWCGFLARRSNPWQFTIRDILLLMFAMAVVLAVWRWLDVSYQNEQRVIDELRDAGWYVAESKYDVFVLAGPEWVTRPFRDARAVLPRCLWRVSHIGWDGLGNATPSDGSASGSQQGDECCVENVNDMLQRLGPKFSMLAHCQDVAISDPELTDIGLQAIPAPLESCRYLEVAGSTLSDEGLRHLVQVFPNIEVLNVRCPGATDEGLSCLATLPNLKFMSFRALGNVSWQGLAQFVKLPNLEELILPFEWTPTKNENESEDVDFNDFNEFCDWAAKIRGDDSLIGFEWVDDGRTWEKEPEP